LNGKRGAWFGGVLFNPQSEIRNPQWKSEGPISNAEASGCPQAFAPAIGRAVAVFDK